MLFWVPLIWLAAAGAVTAPLWLSMGVPGLGMGLLGPLGLLLFKPGENLSGKLVVATLAALPVGVAVAVAMRTWNRMSASAQILSVIGLSVLWHAPGVVLWVVILGGLN